LIETDYRPVGHKKNFPPLRRASNSIGEQIAAALKGKTGEIISLHGHA
jgi:hypothetical protein